MSQYYKNKRPVWVFPLATNDLITWYQVSAYTSVLVIMYITFLNLSVNVIYLVLQAC